MSLVHRHVTAAFLRSLALALAAGIVLFTLVDLFEHLSSFMDNDATISMVARFYLYKLGWIVDTVLPIAMLMATLFTIGSLARYNELTALFAAGFSLLRVARPLLLVSLAAAGFSLAWREYVLPPANAARERVWEVEVHKRPDTVRPTTDIALTGADGRFWHVRRFDAASRTLEGVRIVRTEGPQVVERIDAAQAVWRDDRWTLLDGTRRLFRDGEETVLPFADLSPPGLGVTPEAFARDVVDPQEMNLRQLADHVRRIRESGGDATEAAVDIHFLVGFPLINVIVVFMGIVLASGPRKTTIASGFGLTVLVSFGYYLLVSLGRELGHSGALPPVAAGWGGNAVYALIGWGLWLRARR